MAKQAPLPWEAPYIANEIKNNKVRETANPNLTAAVEDGCSKEPAAKTSPSFLLYRYLFFLSIRVARKFRESRSAVLIIIECEFN